MLPWKTFQVIARSFSWLPALLFLKTAGPQAILEVWRIDWWLRKNTHTHTPTHLHTHAGLTDGCKRAVTDCHVMDLLWTGRWTDLRAEEEKKRPTEFPHGCPLAALMSRDLIQPALYTSASPLLSSPSSAPPSSPHTSVSLRLTSLPLLSSLSSALSLLFSPPPSQSLVILQPLLCCHHLLSFPLL